MKKEWLAAFGQMTYGIYVLTSGHEDVINGMIASWVSQVSYDPPLIMAAVHPNRYSRGLIEKSKAFGLHILDRSQKEMLSRFKGPDPQKKFQGLSWEPGKTGVPILKHCLAWFELRVKEHLEPGNHALLLGEVIGSGCPASGTPLTTLDYEGMYTGKN
ncbi:flavin reductase family protein [Desulfospira joergensenii]|uniref:flavin reductase family protein n=1 Tax=Desulfospira joergensenii TaxID=53329 RepID=UPI0003B432D8|nr:flavin reductase family protein [Desulfospira joergensenii]